MENLDKETKYNYIKIIQSGQIPIQDESQE